MTKEHQVTLNYVVIEDRWGHDVLRFDTVAQYEQFMGLVDRYALDDFTALGDATPYYNVDIDGVAGFDLTHNQYTDGQDIELDNGDTITIENQYL